MKWNDLEALMRRLGRLKWQTTGGSENVGGSQIDGVFRTPECTHLVETTVEREMHKVREDINKLVAAKRAEEQSAYLVDCWLVMLSEPTPDQRTLAKSSKVHLLSIEEFLEPILCKQDYLHLRTRYSFGSVGDPAGKDAAEKIVRFPTPMSLRSNGKDITVETLAERLSNGDAIVLLGDFGAGKSLTVREVFRYLDKKYIDSAMFPVAINLREHWGQAFGTEVFTRHAELIGSNNGSKFYQASREGFVTYLLDGFDEIAPQPWAYDRVTLEGIRKMAMRPVRHLMETRPNKSGVLISGRSHYFASETELCEAVGLSQSAVTIVELRELTDEEAGAFLAKHGVKVPLSKWLPKRPLFLSYLARTGYTDEFAGIADEHETGSAWSRVIDMVCEREAKVSHAIFAPTIRDILCRLAHDMRAKSSIYGPITDQDLETAFRAVTGHQPDHDAWAILQRLPGITFRSEGQKWFVDAEWADALAGIAVAKIILGQIVIASDHPQVYSPLGGLGRMVAASVLEKDGRSPSDLITWSHNAARDRLDPTLVFDCIAVCDKMAKSLVDLRGLVIVGALSGEFDFTDTNLSNFTCKDSVFELLSLCETAPTGVSLKKCHIHKLDGVSSKAEVPEWLDGCDVESFYFPSTNAEVMKSGIPERIKAAIVVLRKTFLQPGRGREMAALVRGIRPETVPQVHIVIRELEKEGYIYVRGGGDPVVHAVRSRSVEVRHMLSRKPDPNEGLWKSLMMAR